MIFFRRKNRISIDKWIGLISWRPYVLLLILGFLLYFQTLFFNFTFLDDNALILEKTKFLSNIGNFWQIFLTDVFQTGAKFYYRPMLNVSFMADFQIGGIAPFIYHFSNIIFHVISAALSFYILNRLLRRRNLSFFLSLLFLVHPVLTQAVAWIPGRNDVLLSIFVLSSFIFFLNFLEKASYKNYILHILFLCLALFTKETAIMLPIVTLIYIVLFAKDKLILNEKVSLFSGQFISVFVWLLIRSLALSSNISTNYFEAIIRSFKNIPAIILSIGKVIFPFNLSVLPVLEDSYLIFGILASLLLLFLIVKNWKKQSKNIIFCVSWFLLFLLPSFLRLNDTSDFIEHRLYLSMFGFLLFLGSLDIFKDLNFREKKVRVISISIIALFSLITIFHSRNFLNPISFWESAVKSSPSYPLTHRNLGAMYYLSGDLNKAETEYLKSLELNPEEPMANNNLGVIHMDKGNLWQAEREFKRELEVNPGYDKALANLGRLYYSQEKFFEAEKYWREALRVNPLSNDAILGINALSELQEEK